MANCLADIQRSQGLGADVWTVEQERSSPSEGWVLPGSADFKAFSVLGPTRLGFSPAMLAALKNGASERYDVLHQHGLWTAVSYGSYLFRRRGKPTVVAPHIGLMPEALRRSAMRKAVVTKLYERRNLESASCLHACSQMEVDSIRAFGLQNPVALIPNGVSEEWLASTGDAERIRRKLNLPSDRKVMLFLSRIHPVKGLPMLLEAISTSARFKKEWVLVIAGMEEEGHEAEVRQVAEQLALQDCVRFVGPLFGQDKRDVVELASVFVLPTKVENFAIAVAEALACGRPVLTTTGAPWACIEEDRCGWWVEPTVEGLASGLERVLGTDDSELRAMGERGRALVAREFTWGRVADMCTDLYGWLLGKALKPSFVQEGA